MIANLSDVLSIYTGSAWLACDGSAVSRTTYAQLFAAIGTTFGAGDGATTFNLPTWAALNSRLLLSLTTGTTFAAFTQDTDIVMNNAVATAIDISAGAVYAGIRVSIIQKSTLGLTVYTDEAHAQSCLLPQGTFLLEWDGVQWCVVGKTTVIRIQFTSGGSWVTPFCTTYTFTAIGGGGGGGGAYSLSGLFQGNGGGGGGGSSVMKMQNAGVSISFSMGSGGTGVNGIGAGGAGGTTTISDSGLIVSGPGGGGGVSGGGGGINGFSVPMQVDQVCVPGVAGAEPNGSSSGAGGASSWGLGAGGASKSGNVNGNPGTGYGGGGGGAATTGNTRQGGNGTAGCVFIEF